MQPKVCLFVLLSVLFMSAESAVDLASAEIGHPDDRTVDLSILAGSDQVPDTDSDPATGDCGHCMYGHLPGVFDGNPLFAVHPCGGSVPVFTSALIAAFRAPPTPPPIS